MTTRIKLRRDTAANWTTANPVLALGEPGYDTTNNKLKVGNGTSTWAQLSYLTDATGSGGDSFTLGTIDLHNGGVQNAQLLQFTDGTVQSVITGPAPDAGNTAQRLIIQGQRATGQGEGGDVYLWGGDSEVNGGDIKIYAGDADSVSAGSGGYVNIDGGRGFDNGGAVEITGGYSDNGPGGNVNISSGVGVTYGQIQLQTGGGQWIFRNDGTLEAPVKSTIDNTGNQLNSYTLRLGLNNSPSIITQAEYDELARGNQAIRIQGQRGYGTWGTEGEGGKGGHVEIRGGLGGETNDLSITQGGEGGHVDLIAGDGQAGSGGGYVTIQGGNATYSNGSSNNVYGGPVYISGGTAYNGVAPDKGFGGDVTINAGQGNHVNGHAKVEISTYAGTWQFLPTGSLRHGNSFTTTTSGGINLATSGIVWTAEHDYISSAKLVIQIESNEVGDTSGWHSQVCEAIIASRGYATGFSGPGGDPVMTVYGVTYTSTTPLATFTVQRNVLTKKIEVVATRTAATTENISFRIHSVEMATMD